MSPGRTMPEDRVHVGTVQIEQGPAVVNQPGDLADLRVEEPDRVGVGHHEYGGLVAQLGLEVGEVDQAAAVALDRDGLEARQVGRGGIGAVGTVGDQDLGALLAAIAEISRGHQQGRQLSLRTRRRLQADGLQAGDLRQDLLEVEQDRQQALKRAFVLIRMLGG